MDNARFERNILGRDFFVGDLHGMYDLFAAELNRVEFNFDIDRVFSVGDLVDRGDQSVDCLLLLQEPWFHAVRGNHEDFLLGSHTDYVWLTNGGEWSDYCEDLNELRNIVNENMHLTMTIDTEYGTIGVVHAESADDWNNNSEEVTANINTWARSRIRCAQDRPIDNIDRMVVGHTPLKEVTRLGNIVYIDTGACFPWGQLTMLDVREIFFGEFKNLGL